VNAESKVLGRLATKVATYLRGKHKPLFTPHVDCGDYIVVINAEKVKVTGKKIKGKMYFTHSGYPAGDKMVCFEKMIATQPEKVIRLAVRGMLPHNRLGDKMINKLEIFRGEKPEYNKLTKLEV
jgi:large subunit ribosomal protein L13